MSGTLRQVHLLPTADAVAAAASSPDQHLPADRSESGASVSVARAAGCKCDRCWFYHVPPAAPAEPELCPRCAVVVADAPA